jgi:hypothetical protein
VPGRRLPGILECGLWRHLESAPRVATRGLVTDVGNDILYGFSPRQVLEWVDEALVRLVRLTSDIVLTDLPLASSRRLSRVGFLVFRSLVVPSCRLSLGEVTNAAERVDAGLRELAERRGARLVHLDPSWYGLDPIHIRRPLWRSAWQTILGAGREGAGSVAEGLRLYLMSPERRWLFGIEQRTPQRGVTLPAGARVWLY